MRADGYKLKNIDPMYKVAAYVMNKRYDAMNMVTIDIPIEHISEYLKEKRKEGINISHMAVILAAYVRVVAEFPELNRFSVPLLSGAFLFSSTYLLIISLTSKMVFFLSKYIFDIVPLSAEPALRTTMETLNSFL